MHENEPVGAAHVFMKGFAPKIRVDTEAMGYSEMAYRVIHADVIVYIFANLRTPFRTEENLLGIAMFLVYKH